MNLQVHHSSILTSNILVRRKKISRCTTLLRYWPQRYFKNLQPKGEFPCRKTNSALIPLPCMPGRCPIPRPCRVPFPSIRLRRMFSAARNMPQSCLPWKSLGISIHESW